MSIGLAVLYARCRWLFLVHTWRLTLGAEAGKDTLACWIGATSRSISRYQYDETIADTDQFVQPSAFAI